MGGSRSRDAVLFAAQVGVTSAGTGGRQQQQLLDAFEAAGKSAQSCQRTACRAARLIHGATAGR